MPCNTQLCGDCRDGKWGEWSELWTLKKHSKSQKDFKHFIATQCYKKLYILIIIPYTKIVDSINSSNQHLLHLDCHLMFKEEYNRLFDSVFNQQITST